MRATRMKWQWLLTICLLAAVLAGCGGRASGRSNNENGSNSNTNSGSSATASGSDLFESLGCIACHQMNGNGLGPSLAGIYGESITLQGGESVTVDDEYIRNSILDPRAQLHEGYQPVMPSFEGRVNEEELTALVEYIRSLSE